MRAIGGKPKLTREAALAFYQAHARTTPSVAAAMRDLRLLSKAELKRLLLWRERMVDARKVLLADLAKQARRAARYAHARVCVCVLHCTRLIFDVSIMQWKRRAGQ
jgi:hypothetical protein